MALPVETPRTIACCCGQEVSAAGSTSLDWELASDTDFTQILQHGSARISAANDHTVKVLVENLQPGQTYFYRFRVDGAVSEPGRTRTLPTGPLAQLGLAIASCSNYSFGFFNAYEVIANDAEIDFVLHLGDYIYEYGADGWGAAEGAGIGRAHSPANEVVSLKDYRERHAQYKTDFGSRLMHAAHPVISTWDDHESTNNPWLGVRRIINPIPKESGEREETRPCRPTSNGCLCAIQSWPQQSRAVAPFFFW